MTADGAVPIHCKVHDGNTTDDSVHLQTWRDLCDLVGSADFLYVADSKLCDKGTMGPIAADGGRFLVVLPTYDERENLPQVVDALAVQRGLAPFPGDVLVVDDASPDGTGAEA